MAKNILIIVLLGAIGLAGYYAFVSRGAEGQEGAGGTVITSVKQKVPVVLYSSDGCSYCRLAKAFFDKKGVTYDVRDVNVEPNAQEMMRLTNGSRSIPQIFINHQHIGGYGELMELQENGQLDAMLQGLDTSEEASAGASE